MASYLTLTSTSSTLLEALPKFEESMLDIKVLRAIPDLKLQVDIPVIDVEQLYVPGTNGEINVHVYRPSDSKTSVLPALIYL